MLSREQKISLCISVGALVLLPVIHVVTYGKPYFQAIRQILVMALTVLWMVTVEKRVVSDKTRKILLFISGHLILYAFATMIKQKCFSSSEDVVRQIWYSSYIPMTAVPMYSFFAVQSVETGEEKRERNWTWLRIPELLIIIGILTNDFHRLAFGFPHGIELGEHDCTHGLLYWASFAWAAVLYLAALITMLRRCRLSGNGKYLWIPLVPLLLGGAFFLVDLLKTDLIRVNGSRVLSIFEVFVLMALGFLECCIEIGMIPSNGMYSQFFSKASFPAVIRNFKGKTFYKTAASWPYGDGLLPDGKDSLRTLSGGIHLRSVNVTGGSLIYEEDFSEIEKLKKEILKETELQEARSAYLEKENELLEERTRLQAKTALYDRIGLLVRPKMQKLFSCIADAERSDEEGFRKALSESCILNAYIKRRSNMELLAEEKDGQVPLTELAACIAESLEYVKLCGMETMMVPFRGNRGEVPLKEAAGLYDALETVLEKAVGEVQFMTAGLMTADGKLQLRLMLSPAESVTERVQDALEDTGNVRFDIEREETDATIRITYGGGRS